MDKYIEEYYEILAALQGNQELTACTVVRGGLIGKKALISRGKVIGPSGAEEYEIFREAAELASALGNPDSFEIGDTEIYLEPVGGEKHFVICGGGHVGLALAKVMKLMEFRVTILEDREEYRKGALEAGADEALIGSYPEMIASIPSDRNTYFAVVTRGHLCDRECLAAALRKSSAYVGMIGSARKNAVVYDKLREEGVTEGELARVHAPIGLKIGAETPAEIAISVAAEVIQVKNGLARSDGFSKPMLKAIRKGERAVLATIVRREGSAPRETGAKMLIFPDGHILGTVGGGRGEADIIRLGQKQLEEGVPCQLYNVDMSYSGPDADNELICGGNIDVFLEIV